MENVSSQISFSGSWGGGLSARREHGRTNLVLHEKRSFGHSEQLEDSTSSIDGIGYSMRSGLVREEG